MNEVLAVYAAIITIAAAVLLVSTIRERRRRKPYRISKEPPALPVKRIRKGNGSNPTRKTRARFGSPRRRGRRRKP